MRKLGIEMLTVFGMPPVEYVGMAADLGCRHISTGLSPVPWNPLGFPAWSLREDAGLRREMIAVMRDRDVSISLADGFGIRSGLDARDRSADLDLLVELGARRISAVSMERDSARAFDQLAILADLAAQRGIGLVLEFAPPHPINNLETALAALRHIARPNAQLMIDAMHFFRSGGTLAQLAALDPGVIGYVQLSDVPLVPRHDDYLQEACFERMIPGQGELPLREFIAALPSHLDIGLEIPMAAAAQAAGLRASVARAVEASRKLLLDSEV